MFCVHHTTMHQFTVLLFEATCVPLPFGACWVICIQHPRSNYKLKLWDLANFKFPNNLVDVDLSIAVGGFSQTWKCCTSSGTSWRWLSVMPSTGYTAWCPRWLKSRPQNLCTGKPDTTAFCHFRSCFLCVCVSLVLLQVRSFVARTVRLNYSVSTPPPPSLHSLPSYQHPLPHIPSHSLMQQNIFCFWRQSLTAESAVVLVARPWVDFATS